MKQKVLFMLSLFILLWMGKNARAQCEVDFSTNESQSLLWEDVWVGQSFTADCDGYLTAIQLIIRDTVKFTGDTLNLYDGLPDWVYPSVRIPFDDILQPGLGEVPYVFNIYDTMPVIKSNKYAFDFFVKKIPDPLHPNGQGIGSAIFYSGCCDRYAEGNLYQNQEQFGAEDLCFKITISDEPPKSYCELSCIENQHRVFDEGQEYYTVVGDEFDPKDSCMGYAETASLVNNINDAATLAGAQIPNNTQITWTLTDSFGNTSECSFMVNVTNDINERLWSSASVYPVPATNKLTVTFDVPHKLQSKQLSVFDITGRIVVTPPVTMRADAFEIDVHSLQTGVYILRVADASGNKALRFIKK